MLDLRSAATKHLASVLEPWPENFTIYAAYCIKAQVQLGFRLKKTVLLEDSVNQTKFAEHPPQSFSLCFGHKDRTWPHGMTAASYYLP